MLLGAARKGAREADNVKVIEVNSFDELKQIIGTPYDIAAIAGTAEIYVKEARRLIKEIEENQTSANYGKIHRLTQLLPLSR